MASSEEKENLTTLQKVSEILHISHCNRNCYNLDDEVALLQIVLKHHGEDRRLDIDTVKTEEDRQ